MIYSEKSKSGSIRRYTIIGGRRLSNYWWALIIFLGGCGFLLTGVSSYLNKNLWLLPLIGSIPNVSIDQLCKVNNSVDIAHRVSTVNTFHSFNDVISNGVTSFSSAESMMPNMEKNLPFFPQGLVLCFYGVLGLCFSFHLWFTIFWQIGGGFNEFNGEEKSVRIFRWGRPGKNRRIDLKYTKESIEAIKVEITPRRALFLCVKGERNIPLTRVGEPIPLEEIEAQAAELTSFLQIPLEMGN